MITMLLHSLAIALERTIEPAKTRMTVFTASSAIIAECPIVAARTESHLIAVSTIEAPRYCAPSHSASPLEVELIEDTGSAEDVPAVRAEFEVLHFLFAPADRFPAPATVRDEEPAGRVRQLSLTAVDTGN